MQYHKLVRDRIPEIIEADGKTCTWEILSEETYLQLLDEKLNEELAEYQESKSLEELADLLEVVQAVHEQLRDRIVEHKESRDPEPLTVGTGTVSAILRDCGIPEARIDAFEEQCALQFGQDAALSPANLIDSGKFEVKTSQATIAVPPQQSYLVETRIIDGRKYFLIPADELIEVNGFGVRLQGREAAGEQEENLEKV